MSEDQCPRATSKEQQPRTNLNIPTGQRELIPDVYTSPPPPYEATDRSHGILNDMLKGPHINYRNQVVQYSINIATWPLADQSATSTMQNPSTDVGILTKNNNAAVGPRYSNMDSSYIPTYGKVNASQVPARQQCVPRGVTHPPLTSQAFQTSDKMPGMNNALSLYPANPDCMLPTTAPTSCCQVPNFRRQVVVRNYSQGHTQIQEKTRLKEPYTTLHRVPLGPHHPSGRSQFNQSQFTQQSTAALNLHKQQVIQQLPSLGSAFKRVPQHLPVPLQQIQPSSRQILASGQVSSNLLSQDQPVPNHAAQVILPPTDKNLTSSQQSNREVHQQQPEVTGTSLNSPQQFISRSPEQPSNTKAICLSECQQQTVNDQTAQQQLATTSGTLQNAPQQFVSRSHEQPSNVKTVSLSNGQLPTGNDQPAPQQPIGTKQTLPSSPKPPKLLEQPVHVWKIAGPPLRLQPTNFPFYSSAKTPTTQEHSGTVCQGEETANHSSVSPESSSNPSPAPSFSDEMLQDTRRSRKGKLPIVRFLTSEEKKVLESSPSPPTESESGSLGNDESEDSLQITGVYSLQNSEKCRKNAANPNTDDQPHKSLKSIVDEFVQSLPKDLSQKQVNDVIKQLRCSKHRPGTVAKIVKLLLLRYGSQKNNSPHNKNTTKTKIHSKTSTKRTQEPQSSYQKAFSKLFNGTNSEKKIEQCAMDLLNMGMPKPKRSKTSRKKTTNKRKLTEAAGSNFIKEEPDDRSYLESERDNFSKRRHARISIGNSSKQPRMDLVYKRLLQHVQDKTMMVKDPMTQLRDPSGFSVKLERIEPVNSCKKSPRRKT